MLRSYLRLALAIALPLAAVGLPTNRASAAAPAAPTAAVASSSYHVTYGIYDAFVTVEEMGTFVRIHIVIAQGVLVLACTDRIGIGFAHHAVGVEIWGQTFLFTPENYNETWYDAANGEGIAFVVV